MKRSFLQSALAAGAISWLLSVSPMVQMASAFDNTNVLVESAVNNIYQKRYKEAHKQLSEAYEQSPRHPGVHFNLGRLFELTGNYAEAVKEYQLAAVLDPSMIAARRGIARCTVDLKRQRSEEQNAVGMQVLDQAARDRASRQSPAPVVTNDMVRPELPTQIQEPAPPIISRPVQRPTVARPVQSAQQSQQLVSLPAMPRSPELPTVENLRVPPLPRQVTQKMRERPSSPTEDRVEGLLEEGKFQKALEIVQPMLETDQDNPRLHYLQGKAFSLKGDLFAAIKNLEEAIRVDEHFHAAYFLLAQNYARVNLLDDAMKNYQIYFKVKPQASVAVEMARIYERMGKSELAREFYAKANAMNPGNPTLQSRVANLEGEAANDLYLRANHAFTLNDFAGALTLYQQALNLKGLDETYRRDAERKVEMARLRAREEAQKQAPANEGFTTTRHIYGTSNLNWNQLANVQFQTNFTEPVTVEWRGFIAKTTKRYGRDMLVMIKELSQGELDDFGRDRNDFRLNPNFNNQPVFLLVAPNGTTFPPFARPGTMITFSGQTEWRKYDVPNDLGQMVKLPALDFISAHP